MKNKQNIIALINISIVLLAFLIFSTNLSYCCDDHDRHHHDDRGDHCHFGCETSLRITDPSVNLGYFFTGSTNYLPSSTGDGNQLEFILVGDSRKSFTFSFSMHLTYLMGLGNAQVTQWTWEKADYNSNGIYGNPELNRTAPYNNLHLYLPRCYDHCKAYAKFRMTAKTLVISGNAKPGNIQFTIVVTATINNI
jgi:hypothetical protein